MPVAFLYIRSYDQNASVNLGEGHVHETEYEKGFFEPYRGRLFGDFKPGVGAGSGHQRGQ